MAESSAETQESDKELMRKLTFSVQENACGWHKVEVDESVFDWIDDLFAKTGTQ